MFHINDLVFSNNDQEKIIYYIVNINEEKVLLYGLFVRIVKEEQVVNLIKATQENLNLEYENYNLYKDKVLLNFENRFKKVIFGKILHIDGDEKYLKNCLDLYKELKIFAWGICIKEKEIKYKIEKIVEHLNPDIVVITGHDNYKGTTLNDLSQYENTKEFVECCKIIRKYKSIDDVIIIAGACGSNFEALIANGANFASSPARKSIHTLDPAIIAIKCATTSFDQLVKFNQILKFIENGREGFGGIESKGKMRLLV